MPNRLQSLAILSLLITFGVAIGARSPQPTPQDANPKAGTFSKPTEKITPPQRVANLQGFGAVGQIPKFAGRLSYQFDHLRQFYRQDRDRHAGAWFDSIGEWTDRNTLGRSQVS